MARRETSLHIVNETCIKTNTCGMSLRPACTPPKIVIKNLSERRNAAVKQRTRLARAGKHLVLQKLVTYRQLMAELALFSANVNQLHNLIDSWNTLPYQYFNVTLIALSIILQIAVGVRIVVVNTFYKFITKDVRKAGIINDMTVVAVYLITILNVFITSFGVSTSYNSTRILNNDI